MIRITRVNLGSNTVFDVNIFGPTYGHSVGVWINKRRLPAIFRTAIRWDKKQDAQKEMIGEQKHGTA